MTSLLWRAFFPQNCVRPRVALQVFAARPLLQRDCLDGRRDSYHRVNPVSSANALTRGLIWGFKNIMSKKTETVKTNCNQTPNPCWSEQHSASFLCEENPTCPYILFVKLLRSEQEENSHWFVGRPPVDGGCSPSIICTHLMENTAIFRTVYPQEYCYIFLCSWLFHKHKHTHAHTLTHLRTHISEPTHAH